MTTPIRWETLLENSRTDYAALERSALAFLVSEHLSRVDEGVDATEKYIAEAKGKLSQLVDFKIVNALLEQKEFGDLFHYWNEGFVEGKALKELMVAHSKKASDENIIFDPEFSRLEVALISKLCGLGLQSSSGFHNEIFTAIFYETSLLE